MTATPSRCAAPVREVWAWAAYDFANTIFSMNVVSRYFPLWVTQTHGAPDLWYSVALSASMLAVAVSVPVLGARSDFTGRRIGPLALLTAACAAATAAIGAADGVLTGLALFAVANYAYQAALVYYDGLLPHVARGGRSVAKVSGYGVSLGYAGAIAGLAALMPVASRWGEEAVFVPTALLFLVTALPCLLLVGDPPRPAATAPFDPWSGLRRLKDALGNGPEHRPLLLFVLALFLLLDGVNTVIAFMSVYAAKAIGMTGGRLTLFLIFSTLGAAGGALYWGRLAHRIGGYRSLWRVCAAWLGTIALAAAAPGEAAFWAVGPMAGVALSGVWTAGRALLVEMAPPERVGEYFGLFNMAGKMASIAGPLVWGGTVMLLAPLGDQVAYRGAVAALGGFIAAGWWLLVRSRRTAGSA